MFYEIVKPDIQKVEAYLKKVLEAENEEVYGMLLPYILRGGKRVRPMLAILCANATGADSSKAIPIASVLELFHNFTLIHDDLMDGSQFRRGEPTLHISHSMPIALNSGDALYTLVWRELLKLDYEPKELLIIQKQCVNAFKMVVEGQGTELEWERLGRFDISEEEYYDMIHGKTAALLGLSCWLGAYCAGAEKTVCNKLCRFGEKIGAAFQIQDDVLNVTGEFKKYKKEIGGDITEGKRTLMVVHTIASTDKETADKIISILSNHSKDKGDIEFVIDSMKVTDSIEYAKKIALKFIDEAEEELSTLPESPAKEALVALCDYIITRES
jgi:geranylgeranyl pyrophosphate synthase